MIDTHAHLDGPEFFEDLAAVVTRAKDVGVNRVFLPNINAETLPRIKQLCLDEPGFFYPMLGLHPEDVNPEKIDVAHVLKEMEKELEQMDASRTRFIAIGEVGLDFYWDEQYRQEQLEVFETQVEWAARYDLPLMIHARNAHAELLEIMNRHRHQSLRGVFHCFTGTAEEATELLSYDDFVLGIGGVLTFKKSRLPEALAQAVPLSRIVLETDSPYMAPVPHRGQRNESAYVVDVAARLAEVYGVSLQQIDQQTTENVRRIFGF